MYVLWYFLSPLAKGSKENCQDLIERMVKEGHKRQRFLILTMEEYESIVKDNEKTFVCT